MQVSFSGHGVYFLFYVYFLFHYDGDMKIKEMIVCFMLFTSNNSIRSNTP